MQHHPSAEFRSTELPDGGLRVELPRRQFAPEAVGPAIIGVFLMAAGVICTVRGVRAVVYPDRPSDLVLFAVSLVLFGIGWFVLRDGLFGLFGSRRVIEVTADGLRVVERLGRLTRTRTRPLHQVRAFEVFRKSPSGYEPKPTSPTFLLEAECAGRRLRLADRLPRPLLTRLAERLGEACRAVRGAAGQDAPRPPVRVTQLPEPEWDAVRPAGAEVVAESKERGARLVVPPLGFWRGRKEPFALAVLFLFIPSSVGLGFVTGRANMPDVWPAVEFAAFMSVFWSAGLFLAYIALRMAYTRTIIALDRGFLAVTLAGIFGASTRRYRRTQIKEIDVGRSGLPAQSRGPYVMEVQIQFHAGGRIGLCSGRNERELRWIVAGLRELLEKAARVEPDPTDDVTEQPAWSRVVLERAGDELTLKIPALGFRGKIPGVVAGGLVIGLALSAGVWSLWVGVQRPWTYTWVGFGIGAVVALLCIAMALEAVAFAFCRRVLTVGRDGLTAWHTTWWGGIGKTEWGRSQMTAIDVGPPNPTGAFLIMPQLQIHLHDRKRPKRLMIYHDEEELLWIASLLRDALRLPAPWENGECGEAAKQ